MPGSMLLASGLGALGLAIAVLVVAVVPAGSGRRGVPAALAVIEHSYSQQPAPA